MQDPLAEAFDAFDRHTGEHKRYLLTTHVGPDGDGLGSALGLHALLAARGVASTLVIVDPLPPKFDFLLEGFPEGTLKSYPQDVGEEELAEYDALILLDCGHFGRLGPLKDAVDLDELGTVCIDHHISEGEAADLTILDDKACATASLIARLYRHWGVELTAPAARALYVSFLTETGSFRFSNTTPEVHRLVADLMDLGIAPHEIYGSIYETKPRSALGLVGHGLAHLDTVEEGKVVFTSLERSVFERYEAISEDADGLVNQILALETAEVAVLLYEKAPGTVKISFRAKNDANVQKAAAAMGGGGHTKAAGATFEGSLEDARARALSLAAEAVRDL